MITSQLDRLQTDIERFSPHPRRVKLIVVTKGVGVVRLVNAVRAGAKHIGENRVQDAGRKLPRLKEKVVRHFIGHVQSNKARKVVQLFDVVHSVDSLRLAERLNKECEQQKKKIEVLLQVNVSGENSKQGVSLAQLAELIPAVRKLKHVKLVGLTTIAPFVQPEYTRPYFKKLRLCAQKFKLKELSMGMSNDYQVALEEGSTMIRIGTAVFRK